MVMEFLVHSWKMFFCAVAYDLFRVNSSLRCYATLDTQPNTMLKGAIYFASHNQDKIMKGGIKDDRK